MGGLHCGETASLQTLQYAKFWDRFGSCLNLQLCYGAILLILPAIGSFYDHRHFYRIAFTTILSYIVYRKRCITTAVADRGCLATFTNLIQAATFSIQMWWTQDASVLDTLALVDISLGQLLCGLSIPRAGISVGIVCSQVVTLMLQVFWSASDPLPVLETIAPSLIGSAALQYFIVYVLESEVNDISDISHSRPDSCTIEDHLLKSCCDATFSLEMTTEESVVVVKTSPELDRLFGVAMQGQNILEFMAAGQDRLTQAFSDVGDDPVYPLIATSEPIRAHVSFEGFGKRMTSCGFDCELRFMPSSFRDGRTSTVHCGLQICGEIRTVGSPKSCVAKQRTFFENKSEAQSSLDCLAESQTIGCRRFSKFIVRFDKIVQDIRSAMQWASNASSLGNAKPGGLMGDVCTKLLHDCGFAFMFCQLPDMTIYHACERTAALFRKSSFDNASLSDLVNDSEVYSSLLTMAGKLKKQGFALGRMRGVRLRTLGDKLMACDVVMIHMPGNDMDESSILLGLAERSLQFCEDSDVAEITCLDAAQDDFASPVFARKNSWTL